VLDYCEFNLIDKMMFAVFMFFVALWAVCIAAPVPGPEGTVATASPFNATTVTSTPALGSVAGMFHCPRPGVESSQQMGSGLFTAVSLQSLIHDTTLAAWCFGIFVIVIVIALLALAINVILSKLRSAWACHLDELAANAAELGLRVKVAEEKAAEEAALRLEAEQRFESCEREVNELRSRLVCCACDRQVTTWLAFLSVLTTGYLSSSGLTCRLLLHRRLLSLSAKKTKPRAPRSRASCPNAPRKAKPALPSRRLPPPTSRYVCRKRAAGPVSPSGPHNLMLLLSQKHVGGSSLAALFRQTFECQEDQAESASFKSVSSECTSQSETCITIPPPATADLEVCVQEERCRPRVALGPS
jgi:hypothetical protein